MMNNYEAGDPRQFFITRIQSQAEIAGEPLSDVERAYLLDEEPADPVISSALDSLNEDGRASMALEHRAIRLIEASLKEEIRANPTARPQYEQKVKELDQMLEREDQPLTLWSVAESAVSGSYSRAMFQRRLAITGMVVTGAAFLFWFLRRWMAFQ